MRNTLATLIAASAFASAPAQAAGGSVFIPAADARWGAVPDAPGVQIAPLQGDPARGPSHFLLKFAGGFSAPLHHHSANHYVTVLAGTLVLAVDGKEQKFGPGSYFSFSGKKKHATRCEAGADCVLAMDVRGRWDVVPEAKPK
jgi:quercetin dioxygenase-like cupin family protein